jgi:hypothetical protein
MLAIATANTPALATENGSQMYPIGTNTVLPGIAPPAGQTWWQNYNLYYSANTFRDGKGESLVPGFKLDVAASAPRIFHGWNAQIGPFGLASAFVASFVYKGVETALGADDDFDLGDVTIQPLYITYANDTKTFFAYSGVDFNLPSGTTVSRRYASADPIIAMTWFPAKSIDVNMIALLEFALSENERTGYRSGHLLVLEYSGHVRPFASWPMLALGLNGYFVDQFSGDEVRGLDIGFEGEAFAVGPEIVYQIGKSGGLAIKWQHEFDVRNRPEGEKLWLEFQVPLRGG